MLHNCRVQGCLITSLIGHPYLREKNILVVTRFSESAVIDILRKARKALTLSGDGKLNLRLA